MEVVLDPELVAQSLDVLVCNGRFDPRLEIQEGLSFGALALYARIFFEGSNSDFERRRRVLRCFMLFQNTNMSTKCHIFRGVPCVFHNRTMLICEQTPTESQCQKDEYFQYHSLSCYVCLEICVL